MSEEGAARARVTIESVDMPFASMVKLVFKWTMATCIVFFFVWIAAEFVFALNVASPRRLTPQEFGAASYRESFSASLPSSGPIVVPYPAQDDPRAQRVLRSCKDGRAYSLDEGKWKPYAIGGAAVYCTIEPPVKNG